MPILEAEHVQESADFQAISEVFRHEQLDYQRFQPDLRSVRALQEKFDWILGRSTKDMSYNPVLARWKWEQLKTDEERKDFLGYEFRQWETTLRERHHTAESTVVFKVGKDGKVYNRDFPNETQEDIIARGVAYKLANNSSEPERDLQELPSWIKVVEKLTDPKNPLDTKMIVMSGKGLAPGTQNKDNFVDIYRSAIETETGERLIIMTRFASRMSYEEYFDLALRYKSDYFKRATGPMDAWLVGNPIEINPKNDRRSPHEIFYQDFKARQDTEPEELFQKYDSDEGLLELKYHYLKVLRLPAEEFDPVELAKAFNAIIKQADLERKNPEKTEERKIRPKDCAQFRSQINPLVFNNISDQVNWLSKQKIEEVAVGCGTSGGINLEGFFKSSSFSRIKQKRPRQVRSSFFGKKHQWFECPKCGYLADRPVGNTCPKEDGGCGLTKEMAKFEGFGVC